MMPRLLWILILCCLTAETADAQRAVFRFPRARPPIPTHFVTPTGDAMSNCTAVAPCTLTRAFELAAGATIPCGSIVSVAAGYYVQAELVYGPTQVCSAGTNVRMLGVEGAVVTGLEVEPSPAGFTNTSGRVWEIAWNEADGDKFTVGLVAQRAPSTWTAIEVTDPPGAAAFSLIEPVNFVKRASIAEVEQHRCTFWNDTTANKVYVHMCHHGQPVAADDLYFGRSRYGQTIVQGDGLWWENIDIEHASMDLGVGFLVEPAAARTVFKASTLLAATADIGGVDTVAEDIEITNVIGQGDAQEGCRDEESETSDEDAESCFNTNAGNSIGGGTALLLGVAGNPASTGQVARRFRIHRNWNGAHVTHANTLTQSLVWGHPNHSITFAGTGPTISHNVSANAQESIHANGLSWDSATIEHNLFLHDGVMWVSHSQEGGTPTTAWTFRNNILGGGWLIEDLTFPGFTASCNVYINSLAGTGSDFISFNNASYGGGAVFSHADLAALKADQTALETNSVELAIGKWTDGTQFTLFTTQSATAFNFAPVPGAQALTMHASCPIQVGPTLAVPSL
jgi:hypothetical protein